MAEDRLMTESSAACSQSVLVVDDQQDFAVGLSRLLLSQFPGLTCNVRQSGDEALQELEHGDYDILITDLRMPGLSGQNLLTAALSLNPSLTVIMLTAFGSVETAVAALERSIFNLNLGGSQSSC